MFLSVHSGPLIQGGPIEYNETKKFFYSSDVILSYHHSSMHDSCVFSNSVVKEIYCAASHIKNCTFNYVYHNTEY